MPGRKSSKRPASRRPKRRTSKQVRSRQTHRRQTHRRQTHRRQTHRRQTGGRVGMPIEYYGGNSGRFTGNAGATCQHAYGDGLTQSHGTDRESGVVGPNLGVYPNSSLMQTGGKPKRRSTKKNRGRRSTKKTRVVRRRRR